MPSISDVAARAERMAPSGLTRTTDTVVCPMLPALDGVSWGRECRYKKLNGQEQIRLLGRVRDGVAGDRRAREQGDDSVPISDEESEQWWNSVWMLSLACVEPTFDAAEAVRWLSTDEENGIACSDVAQFLLHHIRSLNDEAPGMEDLAGGLRTLRQTPLAIQTIENAYLKGGNALDLLLEGKVPATQAETAEFLERWGGIITHVVLAWVRKRARIEAQENVQVFIPALLETLAQIGVLEKSGESPD